MVNHVSDAAMLALLFTGFIAMARYGSSQALVLPVIASFFLVLNGTEAFAVARKSFEEFAVIAIVFSAIAIPAHQLQRSGLFRLAGARLGGAIGHISIRFEALRLPALVAPTLFLTWLGAGLFHNVTSILVMVPIIVGICASYGVTSKWLLCGALVASNLGGFSTSWGDTPNIIESQIWSLPHSAFFLEILPLNFVVLTCLTGLVVYLTGRHVRATSLSASAAHTALAIHMHNIDADEFALDKRLLWTGLIALAGFITIQFVNRDLEVAAGAAAIVFAIAGEHEKSRLHSLQSLGLDVYMTLIAVFIIATSISHSSLGALLESLVAQTGGAIWAIALASYIGTAFTEAASWASAVGPMIHHANSSHAAAWAMGGGICAGSSSLLTAASAGIVLWTESRRFEGHAITFRTYLSFGLGVSFAMLIFYIGSIMLLNTIRWFQ